MVMWNSFARRFSSGILLVCLFACPAWAAIQDDLKEFESLLSQVEKDGSPKANKLGGMLDNERQKRFMRLDFLGKKLQKKLTEQGVAATDMNISKYMNVIRIEWGASMGNSQGIKNIDSGFRAKDAVAELRKILKKIEVSK